MNRIMLVVKTVLMLCAISCVLIVGPALGARSTPGAEGSGAGGYGGSKWYSMGTASENVWCSTMVTEYVTWPPPPHVETHQVTVNRVIYYLVESCFAALSTRECMPGSSRRTFQGGGC